jgi:hypothetical protein
MKDQSLPRQSQEERTTRLALFGAALLSLFRVHVHESDRRLGAIQHRIARCDENDGALFREQIDRGLVPECAQGAGELFFPDRVKRAVERKEAGIAGEEGAIDGERIFARCGLIGRLE